MMRMQTRTVRALGAQVPLKKGVCSTCHYSDRCCCPGSVAEQSESGNREDGFLGGFSVSQDSEGKGESETGHTPAPTFSPLSGQESPEAAPEETMSTAGNLLPAGSQDTVIVCTTEDELRSLNWRDKSGPVH